MRWYSDLAARRQNGGPVSYSEIDAWARLTGHRPTPWEVSVLTRLDDAVLKEAREEAEYAAENKRR